MRIVAFLVLWNELKKGNLVRCLENAKRWSDHIVIYDDGSTDGSQDVYLDYTSKDLIKLSQKNEFKKELYHKQELLEVALKLDPDWLGWIDGDTIFDKETTDDMESVISKIESKGGDAGYFRNINLWKSESWYRIDNRWGTYDHCSVWKNTGWLHYNPTPQLHQNQYPIGLNHIVQSGNRILHYGFATKDNIVDKYIKYKECGQSGYHLNRIIDEQTSYTLLKADEDWYPDNALLEDFDDEPMPLPDTYEEIR